MKIRPPRDFKKYLKPNQVKWRLMRDKTFSAVDDEKEAVLMNPVETARRVGANACGISDPEQVDVNLENYVMSRREAQAFLLDPKRLGNRLWRLNTLYTIVNAEGDVVPFRLNEHQLDLMNSLHYRNVILKARQLGFTTLISILFLDACIFFNNMHVGIIAQSQDTATSLFKDKVKFAWVHFPKSLKDELNLTETGDSKSELALSNGSWYKVSTGLRGSTLQFLHVSEFGTIARERQDRAEEVITGSFPTVSKSGMIFVESTAKGRDGYFYEMVRNARFLKDKHTILSPTDFKFHFYDWQSNPTYTSKQPVVVPAELVDYFAQIRADYNIVLSDQQKWWYASQYATFGEIKMKGEFPSYPDEAFEISTVGAYYRKQMTKVRNEGRICSVPYDSGLGVNVGWDIGIGDEFAMVFHQYYRGEHRIIDYYENVDEDLAHYVQIMQEKGYVYDTLYLPHDMSVREIGVPGALKRIDTLRSLLKGVKFHLVKRCISLSEIGDAVESMRRFIPLCRFDESKASHVIKALDEYRKKYDDKNKIFMDKPMHNWASNAESAVRQIAMGMGVAPNSGAQSFQPKRRRR